MKFKTNTEIDSNHCNVLKHEFLRCEDKLKLFCHYSELSIVNGNSRENSYEMYNAYSGFIHYLYEFMNGCHARDAGDTEITNKKWAKRLIIIDGYIVHHAQRIMNQYKYSIQNATAPNWVNDISYYDVTVPKKFAEEFRRYRNKTGAHASYERSKELNLSEFYRKLHKFLYYIYLDSRYWWGLDKDEFPNLNNITNFSIMTEN